MVSLVLHDSDPADRDLERRVASFLAERHIPALRRLSVEARNGTVTLRGRVRTFYEKQLGHNSASRVAGVHKVIDAVDVLAAAQPSRRFFGEREISPS